MLKKISQNALSADFNIDAFAPNLMYSTELVPDEGLKSGLDSMFMKHCANQSPAFYELTARSAVTLMHCCKFFLANFHTVYASRRT